MNSQSRVECWLNKALEMENRGRDFYENLAKTAHDPLVKDFFQNLANQELIHIKIIKQIFNRLDDDLCWLAAGDHKQSGYSLNKIFMLLTKSEISPDGDILKAIDQGIAFETEAASFYEAEIPNATCEGEDTFLKTLAAEEKEHRQSLIDMKLYYTDPESWAEQAAGIHLDGA